MTGPTIRIEVEPMGKPRQTQSDRWKQRPVVMRYRQFCDDLRATVPDYVLPGILEITFFMPMPKSWSNKSRLARLGSPHEAKPDVDNLIKAFMDAWKQEDKHVHKVIASKVWAEEGAIEVCLP